MRERGREREKAAVFLHVGSRWPLRTANDNDGCKERKLSILDPFVLFVRNDFSLLSLVSLLMKTQYNDNCFTVNEHCLGTRGREPLQFGKLDFGSRDWRPGE